MKGKNKTKLFQDFSWPSWMCKMKDTKKNQKKGGGEGARSEGALGQINLGNLSS